MVSILLQNHGINFSKQFSRWAYPLLKCKTFNGQLRQRRKHHFVIYRNYEQSITDIWSPRKFRISWNQGINTLPVDRWQQKMLQYNSLQIHGICMSNTLYTHIIVRSCVTAYFWSLYTYLSFFSICSPFQTNGICIIDTLLTRVSLSMWYHFHSGPFVREHCYTSKDTYEYLAKSDIKKMVDTI